MPKGKRKSRPVDRESLAALRAQLGTRELARRMGIPAPSLRRLLGRGKSAGLPQARPTWRVKKDGTKVQVTGKAFSDLVKRVGVARASPKTRQETMAFERVRDAVWRGTLDQEFRQIAEQLGMTEREVYTLGVSPD